MKKALSTLAAILFSATVLMLSVSGSYGIGINISESLPGRVYLIKKGAKPAFGLAAFTWTREKPFKKGLTLIKEIAGRPGDTIEVRGRDIYVNGRFISRAKERSLIGAPLPVLNTAGSPFTIPKGFYYMHAPHKDSLDSRYSLLGLVPERDIIGRAVELF